MGVVVPKDEGVVEPLTDAATRAKAADEIL